MNQIDETLLAQIADLHGTPEGAYNIRKDSALAGRSNTKNITIETKADQSGIDIHIRPNTKYEVVHIPVIITQSGIEELVYNDFFIGENCDVSIIAGCGIHNDGHNRSQHDGIHTFHIGKNSHVRYSENIMGRAMAAGKDYEPPNHFISGRGRQRTTGHRPDSRRGLHQTIYAKVVVENGEAILTERLLTHGNQTAVSEMDVFLDGEGASARIISRSVAQDHSEQTFYPRMIGNAPSFGHVQCDSILMGDAKIRSIPAITANHTNAQLIHEAAIGRIAGDQITKLMTLGLTAEEAEERILSGFLK